jgi:hypothetical protein
MTDPLSLIPDSRLVSALMDVVAAFEFPDLRERAARAIQEQRISAEFAEENGLDGSPVVVLKVSTIEEDGAHLLARFDAARFGLHRVDGEWVFTEPT